MDRMLRAEIIATVRQAMQEVLEGADEVWLRPKQLLEQFGMFTHDWLKRYGHTLNPSRAIVIDENGGHDAIVTQETKQGRLAEWRPNENDSDAARAEATMAKCKVTARKGNIGGFESLTFRKRRGTCSDNPGK